MDLRRALYTVFLSQADLVRFAKANGKPGCAKTICHVVNRKIHGSAVIRDMIRQALVEAGIDQKMIPGIPELADEPLTVPTGHRRPKPRLSGADA